MLGTKRRGIGSDGRMNSQVNEVPFRLNFLESNLSSFFLLRNFLAFITDILTGRRD